MPQDHRSSKDEFPLVQAQALRQQGESYRAIAEAIGWSMPQTRRYLRGDITVNGETPTPEPTPEPPIQQKIALASLCVDAGTQMRVQLNLVTIAEYADAMSGQREGTCDRTQQANPAFLTY